MEVRVGVDVQTHTPKNQNTALLRANRQGIAQVNRIAEVISVGCCCPASTRM